MNNLSKLFRFVNSADDSVIFNSENGFLINKPNGIDTLSITMKETQGINQIGTTVISKRVQSRPITISGIVLGNSYKDALIKTFRPDVTGRLYADSWYIDCEIKSTPVIGPEPEIAKFQISLLAPYSNWTSETINAFATVGIAYGFKFPWNISKAYRFGEKIQAKYINVRNTGYVSFGYVLGLVILSGSPTWFKIENMDTGEYMMVEKTMYVGEHIIISSKNDKISVYSSRDGNITGTVNAGSSLFRMNVGDNYIKPTSDVDNENLQCSIYTSNEAPGVAV